MIRLHTPEQAPDDAPRDGDVVPFRRGERRRGRAHSNSEVDRLRERVTDLETDRNALRRELQRQRGGVRTGTEASPERTAAVTTVEAPQPVARAPEARVEGPKTLAALTHLLIQIESKQRDEHTSPAVSADLDAMFERLSATELGQTDVAQTRVVADQLDHLALAEENNLSHNPKRRAAIAAVRTQLQPHLPLRSAELTAAVEELKDLKAREDELLETKPLPKFDSALERQINAAYGRLERTAFSCTPNEAVAIRKEMSLLFRSEQKRWEYKFGSHRWFTSYSEEEKTAQRLYDGRRTMYHARQRQIQNINEKLEKISSSTNMFWRLLGRGSDHLAA